jgi:hypothetical protein
VWAIARFAFAFEVYVEVVYGVFVNTIGKAREGFA